MLYFVGNLPSLPKCKKEREIFSSDPGGKTLSPINSCPPAPPWGVLTLLPGKGSLVRPGRWIKKYARIVGIYLAYKSTWHFQGLLHTFTTFYYSTHTDPTPYNIYYLYTIYTIEGVFSMPTTLLCKVYFFVILVRKRGL